MKPGQQPSTAARRWLRRRWSSLLAGIICALAAGTLSLTAPVHWLELKTQDLRFLQRGARTSVSAAKILIAAVDEDTLRAWPEPILFWGKRFATVIQQARNGGASWIGLDFLEGVDADQYLQQFFDESLHSTDPSLLTRMPPLEGLPLRTLALALLPGQVSLAMAGSQGGSLMAPPPALTALADIGSVDLYPGEDGVARQYWLYARNGRQTLPSLPALLTLHARGKDPNLPALQRLGCRAGPPDSVWINYIGPPGAFHRISAAKLASGHLSRDEQSWLRGAVVLIGATYQYSNDTVPGPGINRKSRTNPEYDGVEVMANTLSTLLDGRPLRPCRPLAVVLLSIFWGVAGAVGSALLGLGRGTVLLAALAGGWWIICSAGFRADLLLPAAGPLLALFAGGAGHAIAHAREEGQRRQQVEGLFGRHVSHAAVARMLENPETARLGGEKREMTILFSDIRNFTTLSETLEPEVVLDRLNQYLGRMADCVFQTGGTLDKYIGDAVMAFWNHPQNQPDHALRACRTAWKMLQALEKLNSEWEALGIDPLRIGVGIHTGTVIVGHYGSETQMNYSVLGDGVNLASRIESANKELHTSILISRATRDHAGAIVQVGDPQRVPVKGRTDAEVYEVLQVIEDRSPENR